MIPVPVSRKLALYLFAILAVMAGYLFFSPAPLSDDAGPCGSWQTPVRHGGFLFNCDSPDYLRTAANPGLLMADDAVRQSRPLYVLAATLLGYPLQWLVERMQLPFPASLDPLLRDHAGYYLAYILLNTLLLLGSLLLFEGIAVLFSPDLDRRLLHLLQLPLLANPVSKAFFWTPHQQFFTVFTPLVTVYLCLQIRRRRLTMPGLAPLSLMVGVGMLAYGNFLPAFACLLISAFSVDSQWHWPQLRYNIAMFLLPTVAWVIFCVATIGHYYSAEVSTHHQLVWIVETLRQSPGVFITTAAAHFMRFSRTFGETVFFIVPATLALLWLWQRRLASRDTWLTCICFGVFFAFFMVLGYYQARLTFTLVPLCLCLLLDAGQHVKWRALTLTVPGLAVSGWYFYTLFSYGPFS